MTNYNDNPGMVRFDFFRPESGKWYMTEALDMYDYWDEPTVHNAVRLALDASMLTRHLNLSRWVVSVLEPYHKNGYPVLLIPGRASYTDWVTGEIIV
jgi:hypothetical protein